MGVRIERIEWTILDSATTSNAQDLTERYLVGLYIPSGFDGTAITFTASPTATGTYLAVYDDANTAVAFTVAQSRYVSLGSSAAARAAESLPWVKLVAGTSQTGDVTITGITVPRLR